jgi:ribose transport system substrate-binding protein
MVLAHSSARDAAVPAAAGPPGSEKPMTRDALVSLVLALLVGSAMAIQGCAKPSRPKAGIPLAPPPAAQNATPKPAEGNVADQPKVALVMKSLANEFFKTMEDGARKHQTAHAAEYELIPNGIKDEQDVAKQIDLVDQMIAQKVSAIVVAPADSKALVGVCKKAVDAGIVVVNIDNRFDAAALKEKGLTLPFVGPDNRKGAKLAGEALAGKLAAGDEVAVIEGAPNAYNATQRALGFKDAIEAKGLKLVASQTANWEMDKANQIVAGIITEHPKLKGILCANDSMALGAIAALKAAGKAGQIAVVGFDNITAVHELVQKGEILATVDQHGDQLAVFGIEYALEMLKSGGTPKDRETPVDLITAKSG